MDWTAILLLLFCVIALCICFALCPQQPQDMLEGIRQVVGDDFSLYYAALGLGTFAFTLWLGLSRYGKVRFGSCEKPQYSDFQWGALIFTSTMAADILFYSLAEWALYASEPYIEEMGGIQRWASTYPLFHWDPIAWSFYIALAVAFGCMFHVRGTQKQKYFEACRPLLKEKTDGLLGRVIDLLAIFSLIAGTATTFSVTTPLLSSAVVVPLLVLFAFTQKWFINGIGGETGIKG